MMNFKESTILFSIPKFKEKQFIFNKFLNRNQNKWEEDMIAYIANILNQNSNFTVYEYEVNENNGEQLDGLLIEDNKITKTVNISKQLRTWYENVQIKKQCKEQLKQRFLQLFPKQNIEDKDYNIQSKEYVRNNFKEQFHLIHNRICNSPQIKCTKYTLIKFFCQISLDSEFLIHYQKGLKIISFVQKIFKRNDNPNDHELENLYNEVQNFLDSLENKCHQNFSRNIDGLLII
ncbi:unnamed protein product [Paramecium sonneborni]|uniref:Uncharacterized protein n=1 Tax=Paramecium sonneborni TaxID=65129 RepID=A0A8S1RCF8_9CILI|nr:unnamed protein product [Paramecium sonneborni]